MTPLEFWTAYIVIALVIGLVLGYLIPHHQSPSQVSNPTLDHPVHPDLPRPTHDFPLTTNRRSNAESES